jgi:hypothetical protein
MTIRTAAEIWRKYEIDGIQSSGNHRPDKTDIVAWGSSLETLITIGAAGLAYATLVAILAGQ